MLLVAPLEASIAANLGSPSTKCLGFAAFMHGHSHCIARALLFIERNMTTDIETRIDTMPGQVVQIGCGPLTGVVGRIVSECDRRWIIELLPGVLVSVAAAHCQALHTDDGISFGEA
jgi:hypothetical protein